MLVGTYYHSLESKGRFSLPKAFRTESESWVLTSGLDGCLFIFREQDFASEVEKLSRLSYLRSDNRAVVRLIAGNASVQQADNLGRLTIPPHLQKQAGLDKQLVIVGSLNRIEVWDSERYNEMMDELEKSAETRAEAITLES